MNRNFHKAQAEALIKQANSATNSHTRDEKISLAQVHAILATVPDEEE